jgi:hypothetical protein
VLRHADGIEETSGEEAHRWLAEWAAWACRPRIRPAK